MKDLESQHGGYWKYDTKARFHINGMHGDRVLPMTSSLMLDGAISDKSGPLVTVEISRSETLQVVRHKVKGFFNNESVIAGIIVNIDETPPFANPTNTNDWDSAEELVEFSRWENVGCDAWRPIMFAGHRWAGKFGCQIELHWAGVDEIFTVSVVPRPSNGQRTIFNKELTALWEAVVQIHYYQRISIDEPLVLDIDSFRLNLWEGIRLHAHYRYTEAWLKANNVGSTIIPIKLNSKERLELCAAVEDRKAARSQKRQRIGHGEEENRE